ncbi:hypothetical protein [Paracraurococcus lichenis]|uniref:Uncharacterized protein n=1 Tax=Paracraurococcus lichenis TaxID=3064888 RepID=A0ABT9EDD3_9PROT|nr:hypothetical protein [Paracraurococcus sp. LOR1-02]MDO9714238.1 hypothetical protein [Paracraurococcus sp. LOR1-02]
MRPTYSRAILPQGICYTIENPSTVAGLGFQLFLHWAGVAIFFIFCFGSDNPGEKLGAFAVAVILAVIAVRKHMNPPPYSDIRKQHLLITEYDVHTTLFSDPVPRDQLIELAVYDPRTSEPSYGFVGSPLAVAMASGIDNAIQRRQDTTRSDLVLTARRHGSPQPFRLADGLTVQQAYGLAQDINRDLTR